MERVKIDRFGRVLIPKKVRNRLGLVAGEELALELQGHKLVLEPERVEARVVRKGRVLVFDGALQESGVDWVAQDREDRMRELMKSDSKS
jgi:AbrB family looped-hinge helix DNA binding protein